MGIVFVPSIEGERALAGGQVVGVLHRPRRAGGDWWCGVTGSGVVHKGLTVEQARSLVAAAAQRSSRAARRVGQPDVSAPVRLPAGYQPVEPEPTVLRHRGGRLQMSVELGGTAGRRAKSCPLCGVPLVKVARHFGKVHPDRMDLVSGIETGTAPSARQTAQSSRVQGGVVQAQAARRSGRAAKAAPPKAPHPGPPGRRTLHVVRYRDEWTVPCPSCGLHVKPESIWEHAARAHPATDTRSWTVDDSARARRRGRAKPGAAIESATPKGGSEHTTKSRGASRFAGASKDPDRRGGDAVTLQRATVVSRTGKSIPDRPLGRAPADVRRNTFRARGVVAVEERWERAADATHLYGVRYRERGRFGSHAAHDGYADEDDA